MGTNYVRASTFLGNVGSTRYLTITTAAAQLFTLNSGANAVSFFNVGTGHLIWGDANVAVNSGNYLFVNGRIQFENLEDLWTIYFRADSVSTALAVTEFIQ